MSFIKKLFGGRKEKRGNAHGQMMPHYSPEHPYFDLHTHSPHQGMQSGVRHPHQQMMMRGQMKGQMNHIAAMQPVYPQAIQPTYVQAMHHRPFPNHVQHAQHAPVQEQNPRTLTHANRFQHHPHDREEKRDRYPFQPNHFHHYPVPYHDLSQSQAVHSVVANNQIPSPYANPLLPQEAEVQPNPFLQFQQNVQHYPGEGMNTQKQPSTFGNILNQFKGQNGSYDMNKMVGTAGQMVTAVNQMTGLVKGIGGIFKS